MYIDRIDLTLPQEDLQSVLEAFASAASILELLPSVGPIDRKRYAKLGLKNEALTLQIIEVGRASRHLIPAGIDFEKIDRDLVAREQLRTLKVILQGLLDRVSDSMLLTGVDLYAAALSMYHCLRRNADTASLRSTVAELKKGFARPSRKKKEEAAATSTERLVESVIPTPMPGAVAPLPAVESENAPENAARQYQLTCSREAVQRRAITPSMYPSRALRETVSSCFSTQLACIQHDLNPSQPGRFSGSTLGGLRIGHDQSHNGIPVPARLSR